MRDQSGRCPRKAWMSLTAILVTSLLLAVSRPAWPATDEDLDQGLTFATTVVNGDYDGDLMTDLVVWRPSDGNWYIVESVDGSTFSQQWGTAGDIPVPGDYDGDFINDFAVWRPS